MDNRFRNISVDLIEKYNVRGSFYTDYPPLGLWLDSFSDEDYRIALKEFISKKEKVPLLLYVHFPYCPKLCTYCQCHHLITQDHAKIKKFLNDLYQEIELLHKFFKEHSYIPLIKEIHLGGGSPSFMDMDEFDQLVDNLKKIVDFDDLTEFTIEIDPRTVDQKKMIYYHEKGINRISFGVQDFDPNVQKAVNRIQPPEMVSKLLVPEIRKFFRSVNFDIIYGLPLQTRESFKKTIDKVIQLSPDRIALCVLGYRPDIFKHHRLLKESDFPDIYESTLINIEAIQNLLDNGYVRIGIDHFAKPTDGLGIALKNKTLHRNALGYTPGICHNMIGIGLSSMSRINDYYFQNDYRLDNYHLALQSGKFPILRGYRLNSDGLLRRDIMYQILCYFSLSFSEIEQKHHIRFNTYFKKEIEALNEFVQDGIIELGDNAINVTPIGKFFLRHICKVFDNLGREYKHSKETAKL